MTDIRSHIETLITKAVKADKSEDAIRFSQAACNVANAVCAGNTAPTGKSSNGYGVVRWEPSLEAVANYSVEIKNLTTREITHYQGGASDKCMFKFRIKNTDDCFEISIKAVGFDGVSRAVPACTLTIRDGDPPEYTT